MSVAMIPFPSKKELKALFRDQDPKVVKESYYNENQFRTRLASGLAHRLIHPNDIQKEVNSIILEWNNAPRGPHLGRVGFDTFTRPLVTMVERAIESYQAGKAQEWEEPEEACCEHKSSEPEVLARLPKLQRPLSYYRQTHIMAYLERHPATNSHALRVHKVTAAVAAFFAGKRISDNQLKVAVARNIHDWTKTMGCSPKALAALRTKLIKALTDYATGVRVPAPDRDSVYWRYPQKSLGGTKPAHPIAPPTKPRGCFRRLCLTRFTSGW